MAPPSKRSRGSETHIRADLLQNDIIDRIKSTLVDSVELGNDLEKCDVEIINNPFTVCLVRNFIRSTDLLKLSVTELKDVTFNEKNNDLYQFRQTDDVSNLTEFSHIQSLYDCLRHEAREWAAKVFGNINLSETISATFSSYTHHDRLLCHDDKCGDRHIAFILYLVENWKEEDGGALQLFSANSDGYPDKMVKSLVPQFNTMVMFEVSHTSFHQVSEVLAESKNRLSINGWFHLETKKLSDYNCTRPEAKERLGNGDDYNLLDYFGQTYFSEENKLNIRKWFLANSEIQLDNFMKPSTWDQIKDELKCGTLKWNSAGPLNIRNYEIADESTLPVTLKTLKSIFESRCWFTYLKSVTALDFVESETSDMDIWNSGRLPRCSCEIQKWTKSSYTLVHDHDPDFGGKALDIVLRIPFGEEEDSGQGDENEAPDAGHLIYIDSESRDEECLLHIGYKMNSLALIYRDEKTLRFTKYLHSEAEPFYQISCKYTPWQPPPDQPHLKHCPQDESTSEEESISDCQDEDVDDSDE